MGLQGCHMVFRQVREPWQPLQRKTVSVMHLPTISSHLQGKTDTLTKNTDTPAIHERQRLQFRGIVNDQINNLNNNF